MVPWAEGLLSSTMPREWRGFFPFDFPLLYKQIVGSRPKGGFHTCASVAQLDRAFGSDPEGRWFESSRAHQRKRPVCGLAFFFGARCGGVIRSLRSLYAKRGASGPLFTLFPPLRQKQLPRTGTAIHPKCQETIKGCPCGQSLPGPLLCRGPYFICNTLATVWSPKACP